MTVIRIQTPANISISPNDRFGFKCLIISSF